MHSTLVTFGMDEYRFQTLQDLMRGPLSKALAIPSNVCLGGDSVFFSIECVIL